jgi:hypothetical protein
MHIAKRSWAPWAVGLLIGLVLLALVPVFLVGDCAHPFGDDYAYSQFVHHALEDGSSLLATIGYTVKRYYFGWQGTYTATVLMSLQPGLISEQAYILTTVVMVLALALSAAFLTHTLLRRWLGQSRGVWLGVTAGLLLVTLEYQPSVMQAFFWWNGAVYYTGYYALMLLLAGVLIRLRLEPKHPRLLTVAAAALAAFLGGGNYVTGLLSCLLAAGCALLYLIWDRRRLWQPVLVGLILLAGLLVNALAPGNSVRQAQAGDRLGVLQTVKLSILQAAQDSAGWFHLLTLGLLVCLVPVLWKALEGTRFSFPLPVAVTALLFLALACQNAPHFFALREAGPGRLRNIVYDSYVWLLILAEGYWLGWLRRRLGGKALPKPVTRGLAVLGLALAAAGCALTFSSSTTGQCAQALSDGSARAYDDCATQWVETLSDPDSGEDVVVTQTQVRPPLLYLFNLTDDPAIFANQAAANYYGKRSVTALPEGSAPPADKD